MKISLSIKKKQATDKLQFSYIGNMGSAQNIEMIVRCFIKSNIDNSILNMCGDGKLFVPLSNKYKNSNIRWHGWLSGKNLEQIYSISDFFILSLQSIGRQGLIIPSKVQSYFMNRKPIICISTGASRELIKKINGGITCDQISDDETIKMYKKALKLSANEKNLMGENSYQYYLRHFTKKNIVNEFLDNIE